MNLDAQFSNFVRDYSGTLYRTAFVLSHDRATAEDLVQETFLRLYPVWDRVENAAAPMAYVRRTMMNVFLNGRRGPAKREVLLAEPPDRPSGRDPAAEVSDTDMVRRLLGGLPPRPRAILVLRYLYDLSDEDIAAELGCRRGTVRSAVSRALSTLRDEQDAATRIGDIAKGGIAS